jgi:hypothetical protein
VYNDALRQAYLVAVVMAALAIIGALMVEIRSVKGKQGPKSAAQSEEKQQEDGQKV